jgi:hypothetical protein
MQVRILGFLYHSVDYGLGCGMESGIKWWRFEEKMLNYFERFRERSKEGSEVG